MHILVVRNNSNPQAIDASLIVATYLSSLGIEALIIDSSELGNDYDRHQVRRRLPDTLSMAIVLGGDGTVLHTIHLLNGTPVPILPVNFGHLGFLANVCGESIISLVADALAGELLPERRARLAVDVVLEGEIDPFQGEFDQADHQQELKRAYGANPGSTNPADEEHIITEAFDGQHVKGLDELQFGSNIRGLNGVRHFNALNEAAITRGALGRVIDLSLSISDVDVARVRGDGLVIATATGSTAYALSAGGPLVSPTFNGMIAVPIAPHSLLSRPLVTDHHDIIDVSFEDADSFREASLFLDGELMLFDKPIHHVYLRIAEDPVTLLHTSQTSFYLRISKDFFRG